ncbi:MAG: hypothetical protein IKK11_02850 [Oscillospiraceae bacterium]|nr:hypothetical protein [Oscillospiraceae bacterium]
MKKALTDRRGVAIEMAILVALLLFALSTLVLTTTLLQKRAMGREELDMTRGMVLEQIGEDFYAARTGGVGFIAPETEEFEITADDTTLTVKDKHTGEVLLQVVLTDSDGKYTVAQWTKK